MDCVDRHARRLEELRRAVFEGDGVTDREVRVAAAAGTSVTEPVRGYAAKVCEASYRVTDEDIEGLKTDGMDEEAVFEITVAAALGAALHRFEAGLRAVSE
ncbi:hypothetical protein [Actinocrispum sp. NPDC049592]|uniref:hypothetical protein n=1 Tax=Actinocrispum sp. NPDC049592 TaxID=3154835 RepID=UPI00341B5D71